MEENNQQIKNEWRIVPGWTKYEVNKCGDLRNFKTKKELKKQDSHRGYWIYICIRDDDNKQHILSAHRAVALAWIPNPNDYPIINHIDEDKKNNYYKNLEWCTYSYNNTYNDINLKNKNILTQKYGKKVYIYNLKGDLVKVTLSVHDAQRFIYGEENTKSNCVVTVLRKNQDNKDTIYTLHNFIFSYTELTKEEIQKRLRKSTDKKIGKFAKNNFSKKVYQYSLDNELIAIYNSAEEARKANNIKSKSVITACCRGIHKTSYGFKWSYEPLENQQEE